MPTQITFIKRTKQEKDTFGGDVYFDIDGRNVGFLNETDQTFDLSPGKHVIKMYKSHEYGTFIGHAESEIDLKINEKLAIKYSSPILITQPGQLIIKDYNPDEIEEIITKTDNAIRSDTAKKLKEVEVQQKNANSSTILWIIVLIIIPLIFFIIEMNQINSIYDYLP